MDNLLQDTSSDSVTGVIDVVENPNLPETIPKVRLSNDINVTAEFRDEYDNWLQDKFGSCRVVYMIDGKVALHPENMQILKNTA